MAKKNLPRPEDDELQKIVRGEIRRLQKTLATLLCLKMVLTEEQWDEIDCEDVAAVVCKLLSKSIRKLDAASTKHRSEPS